MSFGCKGGSPLDALKYARKHSANWYPYAGLISQAEYQRRFNKFVDMNRQCEDEGTSGGASTPGKCARSQDPKWDAMKASYFPSGMGEGRNHYCIWFGIYRGAKSSPNAYHTRNDGFWEIKPSSSQSMQAALHQYGALMVKVRWNGSDVRFLDGGILTTSADCGSGNGEEQEWWLTITGSGYDERRKIYYWEVKNSMLDWGANGYGKIQMTDPNDSRVGNDGVCGIQRASYFAAVDGAPCPNGL